jgi:hypothetical protein
MIGQQKTRGLKREARVDGLLRVVQVVQVVQVVM